ncbi:superoxide dismutase family protein [Burkholderia sp. WAC0059]|uniref:superoxide dismutase family protein n=1 Tax=Burkholderia sp. WAC0059 TaxID=2066022 RepID=UPI000C7F50A2|nr:superoxide dismutase family protein [Burkholderia sp. WAC0059]PLZ00248.1 superoxide dismutase family protein [Burkholderia sp. WAC0059]
MGKRLDAQTVQACAIMLAGSVLLAGCSGFFLTPQEKRADAQLVSTLGNQARGTVTFVERSDGVQVSYNLAGLPPDSDHALEIHERADCNAADGSSAGSVFAPAAQQLKPGERVEGELGNIHADSNGVATGFMVEPDLSLDGVRSVLQRSVLVYRDALDPYAWPARGVGPAISCGVIRPQ